MKTTLLLLMTLTGCSSAFEMKTPSGFARVEREWDQITYKGIDDVGLRVDMFGNLDGGTLDFWTHDLTSKLGARGYQLVRRQPIASSNGVAGTTFEFVVDAQVGEHKFFIVSLFVTDEYRIVMQLAGDESLRTAYWSRNEEFANNLRIRGCHAFRSVCRGPTTTSSSTPRAAGAHSHY